MPAFAQGLMLSAKWCAWLTVPICLAGLFLLDAHGTHLFPFTEPLGLAIIYPLVLIHDSGLQYRMGGYIAWPLILVAQWAWLLIPVHLVRAMYGRTHKEAANS